MDIIQGFQGEHRFLSNFSPSVITCTDGITYATVEHAYQAAKYVRRIDRQWVAEARTPGRAKRRGRSARQLHPNWNLVKYHIMLTRLRLKFEIPELRVKLLATGDAELQEVNGWGDREWGIYRGEGNNMLGKLLMQLRAEIGGAPW